MSAREGLGAGALGGGVALLVLLAGATLTGTNGFLEAVHDGVTLYLPLGFFDAALGALGSYAKGLLSVGIALGLVAVGALVGSILARAGVLRRQSGATAAVGSAILAWLVAELVVLPLAGAGAFGSELGADPLAFHGPLILAAAAYGAVLVGVVHGTGVRRRADDAPGLRMPSTGVPGTGPLPGGETSDGWREGASPTLTRRSFLGRSLVLVGLGSLGVAAVALLGRVLEAGAAGPGPAGGAAAAPVTPTDPFGVTPAVTPLGAFYVVGKDLTPTDVDAASWRLSLSGLVDRPATYTLDQLRAMPAVEGYRTLECISNPVVTPGDLIGTQRWRGLRAADLLAAAGVRPEATFVLWRSADGYTESIPVDVARDQRTWLVYEMGPPGTPLPKEHGFPLRVLIAGRYGMKQPKYLTDIVLADHDEPGFWEQRGWDEAAIARTYSRIDLPAIGSSLASGSTFTAYGIASAGDRGISRVEVSVDGGTTWRDAELEPPGGPISDLTWVRWRAPLVVPAPGRFVLTARATDGRGTVEDATPRPQLPSGATGLPAVRLIALPAA